MFIDEKIREYIEQEKEGWQEVRKNVGRGKSFI